MSTAPFSPKLIKGGLVLVDPESAQVQRVISLQYNADTLTRKLQAQEAGGEGGGNRAEPMRFKGPAVETISFEADIDATDQLEFPDQNANAIAFGIAPQLAVLEALSHPSTAQLQRVDSQASSGTLEIAPMLAPLLLFVWGKTRIIPVKLTDFSITEEAFDPALNPSIRVTACCVVFCSVSMVFWISVVDVAVRLDSTRTSSATTAKPRPCSPARAASIAAFNANKLVCSAIP